MPTTPRADNRFTERYLVEPILERLAGTTGWILDLGCGPGALTGPMAARFEDRVVGIDRSGPRLDMAIEAVPTVQFHHGDVTDPLPAELHDRFEVVVSTEVIEHLPLPRTLFERATESGARRMLLTTPYHAYLKNLAIAVRGGFDEHWQTVRDYGHVKFFSVPTLTAVARDRGWEVTSVARLGRVAPLAKSMLVELRRP